MERFNKEHSRSVNIQEFGYAFALVLLLVSILAVPLILGGLGLRWLFQLSKRRQTLKAFKRRR